jgi:hypothetical protein
MKRKHNYPPLRKPALKKQCPHCNNWFHARGLHRHILEIHRTNSWPPIGTNSDNNLQPYPLPKTVIEASIFDEPARPLLRIKQESKPIETFEKCISNLQEMAYEFLEAEELAYCFIEADLAKKLRNFQLEKHTIVKSTNDKYLLEAFIVRLGLRVDVYKWTIVINEIPKDK